jgi:hypothetical protein
MSTVAGFASAPGQQRHALADVPHECAPIRERYPNPNPDAIGRAAELFERFGRLEDALKESPVIDSIKQGPHSYSSDARSLRDISELIVVGTVRRAMCYVTVDSRQIVTGLTVDIEQVLKGTSRPGEQITVGALGGRIVLAADSWVQTRWFFVKTPKVGDRIVSFLISNEAGLIRPAVLTSAGQPSRHLWPLQGGNGTFIINSDETLEPILVDERPGPTLATSYNGKKLSMLLADLKANPLALRSRRR